MGVPHSPPPATLYNRHQVEVQVLLLVPGEQLASLCGNAAGGNLGSGSGFKSALGVGLASMRSAMLRMTIGTLAAASGVKVTTIRYYERAGLMPAPPRTTGGQRDYTR